MLPDTQHVYDEEDSLLSITILDHLERAVSPGEAYFEFRTTQSWKQIPVQPGMGANIRSSCANGSAGRG